MKPGAAAVRRERLPDPGPTHYSEMAQAGLEPSLPGSAAADRVERRNERLGSD